MTVSSLATAGQSSALLSPEDRLRAALRPSFLVEAGWDARAEVLSPPRDHRLLGLRKCVVVDCLAGVRSAHVVLCQTCDARFRQSSATDVDVFAKIPSAKQNRGELLCRVPGCPRPSVMAKGLCASHRTAYQHREELSVEEWIVATEPDALSPLGPCLAVSCVRLAASRQGLCVPHSTQWRIHRREEGADKADFDAWAATAMPISLDHVVILRGLPDLVQLEILVGLQHRTERGLRTFISVVRAVAAFARRHRVATLEQLAEVPVVRGRQDVTALLNSVLSATRMAQSSIEEEQRRDVWNLGVFGLGAQHLVFTHLSQPWLRETAKHWVAEDLPLHRGRAPANASRTMLTALGYLSQSLRTARADHGDDLARLGRRDVLTFITDLVWRDRAGELPVSGRPIYQRAVRRFLDDVRAFGLTQPGQPLAGLPADFVLRTGDAPVRPREEGGGRDLPESVLRIVAERVGVLEELAGVNARAITELLIDTGRRPDEICRLPWDCLVRDPEGKPVLIYHDFKNDRPGRRLPIGEHTADLISTQKAAVAAQFPKTSMAELALFPRRTANPRGTRAACITTYSTSHRAFITAIAAELLDEEGQPFNCALAVPYAYRHSYAQRHADSGVGPDVLRDLMGHRSMQTTLGYYRITEVRVRAAVNRVAEHQFDGSGRRVFRGVGRLLGDEHARLRVGQVAVPFGVCTEPSNVKAGGKSCPYRFTCLGCGHFRSDPSYLPELKSYLQQLLADREHVLASTDLEDWARAKALPAEEEITQLRHLIRKIEADLDELSEVDRDLINVAVATIRKVRQTVDLGMPGLRPTPHDEEPNAPVP